MQKRVFCQVELSDWGWYRKSVPPPQDHFSVNINAATALSRQQPVRARGEPHAVGVGPPRERLAGCVLYQRRRNGGMLRGPLVHRFLSCLSWSAASAVRLRAFFAHNLPAGLSVLVTK